MTWLLPKLTTADRESLEILKRAKRLNPEVKIMVVSGNDDAIFPLEVYQVEVDDYLLMPVNPTELWRRVSQLPGGSGGGGPPAGPGFGGKLREERFGGTAHDAHAP